MDYHKTRKPKEDTRDKQEDSSECGVEGYGRAADSSECPEDDTFNHRRQESDGNTSSNKNCGNEARSLSSLGRESNSTISQCHTRQPSLRQVMTVSKGLQLNLKKHRLLRCAKLLPPVTKGTLSELDLERTQANIHLRLDINFDSDLHFQPRAKDEKGRKEVADYWEALAIEMSIYAFCAHNQPDPTSESNPGSPDEVTFEPRLPAMFETLRDVLQTLVPEHVHSNVTQILDVSLRMQEVKRGVLDLDRLSEWLKDFLQLHCAPMRDAWADRMAEQIKAGSTDGDPRKVTAGLETLFGILEAMKLDVANHQIRAFRVALIEDTIPFLQRYLLKKIAINDFNVEESKLWYWNLQQFLNEDSEIDGFWPVAVMFRGLVGFLLQFEKPRSFPQSFQLDSGRLWLLRADIQRLITHDICWYILDHLTRNNLRRRSSRTDIYSVFWSRIWPLLKENENYPQDMTSEPNTGNVALELARIACAACGSDDINVVSDDIIASIEATLEVHLSAESDLFRRIQATLQEKLLQTTFSFARKYLQMSPFAMYESQRRRRNRCRESTSYRDEMEAISMRLAHIGVINWSVWAPLVYVQTDVPDVPDPQGTALPLDTSNNLSGEQTNGYWLR